MALGGVADNVARAVAEFGDDAVRSVMKASPELRKRLAALAKRQANRALEQARSRSQSLPPVTRSSYLDGSPQTDILDKNIKALQRMFESTPLPKAPRPGVGPVPALSEYDRALGTTVTKVVDPEYPTVFLDDALDVPYWDEGRVLKQLEKEKGIIADRQGFLEGAARANDDENLRAYYEQQAKVAQGDAENARDVYDRAVFGIAAEGRIPTDIVGLLSSLQTRGGGLFQIEENLRPFLQKWDPETMDLAPAIDQARLLSILNAIGDAQ